jgi:hypothetical protein
MVSRGEIFDVSEVKNIKDTRKKREDQRTPTQLMHRSTNTTSACLLVVVDLLVAESLATNENTT